MERKTFSVSELMYLTEMGGEWEDYDIEGAPLPEDLIEWEWINSEQTEMSLEDGSTQEDIIFLHKPSNRYFLVNGATFIYMEGYVDEEPYELIEVEPYEATVIKYRVKEDGQDKGVLPDEGSK